MPGWDESWGTGAVGSVPRLSPVRPLALPEAGCAKQTQFQEDLQVGSGCHYHHGAGPIAANNLSLWIGWDSHRTENAWNGRIDDVRIYSYALDAKEIGTLYESSRKPGDTIK